MSYIEDAIAIHKPDAALSQGSRVEAEAVAGMFEHAMSSWRQSHDLKQMPMSEANKVTEQMLKSLDKLGVDKISISESNGKTNGLVDLNESIVIKFDNGNQRVVQLDFSHHDIYKPSESASPARSEKPKPETKEEKNEGAKDKPSNPIKPLDGPPMLTDKTAATEVTNGSNTYEKGTSSEFQGWLKGLPGRLQPTDVVRVVNELGNKLEKSGHKVHVETHIGETEIIVDGKPYSTL